MRTYLLAVLAIAPACGGLFPPQPPVRDKTSTFPLVGPLENRTLLTPVMISGEGPYLFAIDPAAPHTVINVTVIAQVIDPAGQDSAAVDLTIGDLTIGVRDVQFAGTSLDRDGRSVDGVIGRDVLADAYVFGFDRGRGVAWLAPATSYRPPAEATPIAIELPLSDDVARIDAKLDRENHTMILALGTEHNELHRALWRRTTRLDATVVDDFGNRKTTSDAGAAETVIVGGVSRTDQVFVDPELARSPADGVLGLRYFEPFSVAVNRATRTVYVTPRGSVPAETRIGRWGNLPCADLGCARVERVGEVPGATRIVVTRDPATHGHDLEITVATAGSESASPALVFNLPAGVDHVSHDVPVEFAGTDLAVIDLSPFPRPCHGGGGCVTSAAPL